MIPLHPAAINIDVEAAVTGLSEPSLGYGDDGILLLVRHSTVANCSGLPTSGDPILYARLC